MFKDYIFDPAGQREYSYTPYTTETLNVTETVKF